MKRFFVLLIMALGGVGVNAQVQTLSAQPTSNDAELQIEGTLRSFYAAMDETIAAKNGNIEPVVKMMDKDFTSERVIIDVTGRQTRSELTLDTYRGQLNQLSSIQGFKTRQEILKISFVRIFESFALVNYTLQISGILNEEEVIRFKSYVTTYFRRNNDGQWVIFESNGLNVYQDQEIGVCPVSFTKVSKDESLYSASILSPAGNNFKSDKLEFAFKQGTQKTLITCGKNTYVLEASQLTCVVENGSTVSIKLGRASSPIESINVILSQHLYAGKCLSFKTMEK